MDGGRVRVGRSRVVGVKAPRRRVARSVGGRTEAVGGLAPLPARGRALPRGRTVVLRGAGRDSGSGGSGSAERTSSDSPSSSSSALKLAALASGAGALETAYLTASKLFSSAVFCPTNGCETILTSKYSEIYGIPVSLFGFLTYAGVSYLSWVAASEGGRRYRDGVLGGATVLASVSAFLGYVLFTQFPGEECAWCLTSVGLSFSTFALALWATAEGDPVKTTLPPVVISPLVVSALVLAFGADGTSLASEEDDFELPYKEPLVTTQSTSEAVLLVKKLNRVGAKMYGAFWCSHCFDQKQEFGKEAMKDFPYVECFPSGWRKGAKEAKACEDAEVRGFPTWVIRGEKIEGDQTLQVLEETADKYLKASDYL